MVEAYVISAVIFGSLFALMAIGLTLTYLTTKVPNFAYGSFVAIGIYTAYTLFKLNAISPYYTAVVSFVIAGLASAVMYLLVLKPLARRGASLVSLMIATFGVDIGFIGILGIYLDYIEKALRLRDTRQFFPIRADFSVFGIPGMFFVAPLTLAILTVALYLLLTRTKFGVAMRASIENPPLARVLGINVERVYMISWLFAGGLAGLAGSYHTIWLGGRTSTGSELIVEIFASSILGGLGSIYGAVLGGLMIGVSEASLTVYISQGFGLIGTGIIVALLLLSGVFLFLRKKKRARLLGALLAGLGAYVAADVALGFPTGFFSRDLVSGFGPGAFVYQKGVPLIIMVIALLLLPKGLISVEWKRLLRLRRVRSDGPT
ncbi:MAG: branched-chain amino acid ABC transporter permease [Thaumarchaeota archaeon]|nr:branched-chain amino acid ABC transporter permease [Nitrososphaerota archaeon]